MRCHTGKGLTCAEVRPGHRPRLIRIVEADEVLETVKEKHPTHGALQEQCAKVKAEVEVVRMEMETERMNAEDKDLVRKGMETERMTAEDKDVGAENEEAPPQSRGMRRRRRQHPDVANPAAAVMRQWVRRRTARLMPEALVTCSLRRGTPSTST